MFNHLTGSIKDQAFNLWRRSELIQADVCKQLLLHEFILAELLELRNCSPHKAWFLVDTYTSSSPAAGYTEPYQPIMHLIILLNTSLKRA